MMLYTSYLPQLLHDEIKSVIRKLKNNFVARIDELPGQMLKHTASSISPILCNIFNLSLIT